MREGCYEVVLVDQDGHKLDEVVINDQFYVVALPGKEYVIKIIVHEDINHSYPAENLRVGLYVDGVDVQYWKRLDLSLISEKGGNATSSVHTIFHGYKKSSNDLRSFIFAKTLATSFPSSSSSSSDHINNSSFGTIKVVIYEAIQVEGVYQNVGGKYEVPGQHSVNVDGKFYKQPSVTTMAGRNITETEKFIPLLRWKNKSEIPLMTLNLFYHTQEMIQFLKLFHESTSPSSSGQNETGKRKYQELIDLTDDSIIPIPPPSFPCLTPPSTSIPSTTVVTAVRSHIPSSSCSSSSSFFSPSYTISSSESASDEVEVLTVVKEIPMFDLTAAQVDSDEE
jgi:hypothetical protein